MNKKSILKQLKNQKGLTGADIVVAISVIVITVVVITMIYLNISNNNKSVNRTAGATKLATNILENIELTEYDSIESLDSKTSSKIYNTVIPNGYDVVVDVKEETDLLELVKNVTVEVKYEVGGEEQIIKVSTVAQQKYFEECNKPNFSAQFLKDSVDSETKGLSGKIIVPIKYSYITKKYVVTTEQDKDWYNYSSKEWAKILVFENEQIKDKFIDSDQNIITEVDLNEDGEIAEDEQFIKYLYVWIPNFGKSKDTTLADGTIKQGKYYFRYGDKNEDETGNQINNALVFSDVKTIKEIVDGIETEKILNSYMIDESIEFENVIIMEIEGVWREYTSEIDEDSFYGQLTLSQYGPMIIR